MRGIIYRNRSTVDIRQVHLNIIKSKQLAAGSSQRHYFENVTFIQDVLRGRNRYAIDSDLKFA